MTDKVRNLVLTSSILATSIILVLIQIPLLGMGLDLSFIAIILGRRYIGFGHAALICLLYPWVSVGFMGPIGALFIIIQSLGVLSLDWLFNRKDYSVFGVIMVVLLGTLWSVLINFVLIVPMYWYLAGETSGNLLGNYTDLSDQFLKYEMSWMITGIVFNPIKLGFVYAITYGLWIALENSVNQEPNYYVDQETGEKVYSNKTIEAEESKEESK